MPHNPAPGASPRNGPEYRTASPPARPNTPTNSPEPEWPQRAAEERARLDRAFRTHVGDLVAQLREGLQPADGAMARLVALGQPVVGYLIPEMERANPAQRACIAWVMGEIRDVRAIEPLSRLLLDSAPNTRYAAVMALGRIPDGRTEPLLRAMVRDADPGVSRAAALILAGRDGRGGTP